MAVDPATPLAVLGAKDELISENWMATVRQMEYFALLGMEIDLQRIDMREAHGVSLIDRGTGLLALSKGEFKHLRRSISMSGTPLLT